MSFCKLLFIEFYKVFHRGWDISFNCILRVLGLGMLGSILGVNWLLTRVVCISYWPQRPRRPSFLAGSTFLLWHFLIVNLNDLSRQLLLEMMIFLTQDTLWLHRFHRRWGNSWILTTILWKLLLPINDRHFEIQTISFIHGFSLRSSSVNVRSPWIFCVQLLMSELKFFLHRLEIQSIQEIVRATNRDRWYVLLVDIGNSFRSCVQITGEMVRHHELAQLRGITMVRFPQRNLVDERLHR